MLGVMETISSIAKLAARDVVALLLLFGWMTMAAAAGCASDEASSGGAGSGALNQAVYSGDAGRTRDCCVASLNYAEQAVPAKEASTFRSGPAALPSAAATSSVEAAVNAPTVSVRTGDERPHPPFYLLYRRFLIPFFL